MDRITSRHNPLVARFRDAARATGTDAPLLLDGPHLVEVALATSVPLSVVAVREHDQDEHVPDILARLAARRVRTVSVTAQVMDAVSPVRSASPVVALAERARVRREDLVSPAPALVLVAAGVQDPGNVGALVRAADAAGATGVVTTAGSADPFGWKALRGSMGSTLRLPVWAQASWGEAEAFLRRAGLAIIGADAGGRQPLYDHDLTRPMAVIVGAEGLGLERQILRSCDDTVHIPMRSGVESLNVAVSAALLAYEARRQRARRGARS